MACNLAAEIHSMYLPNLRNHFITLHQLKKWLSNCTNFCILGICFLSKTADNQHVFYVDEIAPVDLVQLLHFLHHELLFSAKSTHVCHFFLTLRSLFLIYMTITLWITVVWKARLRWLTQGFLAISSLCRGSRHRHGHHGIGLLNQQFRFLKLVRVFLLFNAAQVELRSM